MFLLHSAIVLTVLYIPFQLLLRKERYFTLNRAILLLIMLASLVLPLTHHTLPVEWFSWTEEESVAMTNELQWNDATVVTITEKVQPSLWQQYGESIFVGFWALGALMLLIWQVKGGVSLYRILYGKECIRQQLPNGNILCISTLSIPSFSWMHHIVISSDDFAENGETILAHEEAHIVHHHSLDKLLLLLCQTLQWWNPFVWLLGDSLNQVHEYEADQSVIAQGFNPRQYQLLLISKAAGPAGLAMVNGFKHNKLKSRIIMMNNKTILRGAKYRYLALLPMSLLAIVVTAKTQETFCNDAEPISMQTETCTQDTLAWDESVNIGVGNNARHLGVKVSRLGKIMCGTSVVTMDQLDQELTSVNANADDVFEIEADTEAPAETIGAVKQVLRKHNIAKIEMKIHAPNNSITENSNSDSPLIILGEETILKGMDELSRINHEAIESIFVYKDEAAKEKYYHLSPLAKNGVVQIKIKEGMDPYKK